MKLLNEFDASDAGHTNVGNNDVKWLPGEQIQSLTAIGSFSDVAAKIAKPGREDFPHVGFIVGNQNAGILPRK
jgi:hypothetical protein